MDPNTVNLIVFAEEMAALLAKTIVDIRNVITNANTQATDQILADADATWNNILAKAQGTTPPVA